MGDLEKKLGEFNTENAKLNVAIEGLNKQLSEYDKKLSELKSSQQKTGIISEALKPKGEVTFEDVHGLAKEVSDTAYQRIRDYFLLEMVKKGYECISPDFSIRDTDSKLRIEFLVTGERQIPHAGWDSGQEYKSGIYLENIPELKEVDGECRNKEKVLFSISSVVYSRDWLLLNVRSYSPNDWAGKLRKELPVLLQAYMLGYSLKCLDERKFDTALIVKKKHGLKDNRALLARMREIMKNDPTLATKFVIHYASE